MVFALSEVSTWGPKCGVITVMTKSGMYLCALQHGCAARGHHCGIGVFLPGMYLGVSQHGCADQRTPLWDHCLPSLGCVCEHCSMGVQISEYLCGISVSLHLYAGSGD